MRITKYLRDMPFYEHKGYGIYKLNKDDENYQVCSALAEGDLYGIKTLKQAIKAINEKEEMR